MKRKWWVIVETPKGKFVRKTTMAADIDEASRNIRAELEPKWGGNWRIVSLDDLAS